MTDRIAHRPGLEHASTESYLGRGPAPDHHGVIVEAGLRWDVARWQDGHPVAWRTEHMGSTWHLTTRSGEVRLTHVSPRVVGSKVHQVSCTIRRLEGEPFAVAKLCSAIVASYTHDLIARDVAVEWARIGAHLKLHAEAVG